MTSLQSALPNVPVELRETLEQEFLDLDSRFAAGDWEPANLNGGRFAEAVLRFLEWRQSGGGYTPIGKRLNRSSILSTCWQDTRLPDSYRSQIPLLVELLMDLRNKRDIAHLGSTPDVKEMDSHLVIRAASWILAELVREESKADADTAQELISRLSSRRIPLVEEIDGELIVLATNLSSSERGLVALYKKSPEAMGIDDLRSAVGYQNKSRFRALLSDQATKRLVHIREDTVRITKKGIAWVENNVEMRLEI